MTSQVSRQEEALLRRLQPAPVVSCHEVRLHSLGQITSWPEWTSCRLTVEAVMSATLQPNDPIAPCAKDQLRKCNQAMTMTVALMEAQHSPRRRSQVFGLLGEIGNDLICKTTEIWDRIRQGENFHWYQIVDLCGSEWSGKYPSPMPPDNEASIYKACRRLMPDTPTEDLPGVAVCLAGDMNLDQNHMPTLRRQIVILTRTIPGLMQGLDPYFPVLSDAAVSILTASDMPWDNTVKPLEGVSWLYELCGWAIPHLLEYQDGNQLSARLLETTDAPWVWFVAEQLMPFAGDNFPFLPQLLYRWMYRNSHRYPEHGQWKQVPPDKAALTNDEVLARVAISCSYGTRSRLLRLCSEASEEDWGRLTGYTDTSPHRILLAEMLRSTYTNHYSDDLTALVVSGESNTGFVELALGMLDDAALSDWFENYLKGREKRQKMSPELTQRLLGIDDIVGSELIGIGWLPKKEGYGTEKISPDLLQATGYRLKSRDVAGVDKVHRLLGYNPSQGRVQLRPTAIWHDAQWRDMIASTVLCPDLVIGSILVGAEHQIKSNNTTDTDAVVAWLEETLIPVCNSKPAYRAALCSLAIEPTAGTSARLARRLLASPGRIGWIESSGVYDSNVQAYFRVNWWGMLNWEQQFCLAYLGKVKSCDLFFEKALDDRDFPAGAGNMAWLFEGPDEKDRLAHWLTKNQHKIEPERVINWIVQLALAKDCEIAEAMLDKYQDHPEQEVQQLAVAALQNTAA